MSKETQLVPVQAVALDELPARVIEALDVLASIIPDLRKPHPSTVKKVRSGRTVSREAITSIIAMVESSEVLQKLTSMDTERAREVVESRDDFRLLAERIEALQAQVKYTNAARWAEVAKEAMHAFRIAAALADKDPREGDLAAHLATVRRHLGRRNATTAKRRKPV